MSNILKNIYFILIVLTSGLGMIFFRTPESDLLLFFISLVIFFIYKIKFNAKFWYVLLIWFVYFILSTISVGSFHAYFMVRLPIQIFIAYVLIQLFEDEIMIKYEKIIFYLALISLLFFLWQIINPDSLFGIMQLLDVNGGKYIDFEKFSANIIIYSVNHFLDVDFPRNAGFCWEPGPFGCFIVVAMFFNMIRTDFTFRGNFIFWILFIVLLTTQSTTAIITFLLLFVWVVFNNNFFRKISFFVVPIIIVLLIVVLINVPFLMDKIISEYSQTEDTEQIVNSYVSSGNDYAPGRFLSFQITWQDFIERPLLGYGGNYDLQWTKQLGASIFPVSGIGNILANFGLYGFLCWLLIVYNSGKYFRTIGGNYWFGLVWLLIMISISIGFMIIMSPVFISFYLLSNFKKTESEQFNNI